MDRLAPSSANGGEQWSDDDGKALVPRFPALSQCVAS